MKYSKGDHVIVAQLEEKGRVHRVARDSNGCVLYGVRLENARPTMKWKRLSATLMVDCWCDSEQLTLSRDSRPARKATVSSETLFG